MNQDGIAHELNTLFDMLAGGSMETGEQDLLILTPNQRLSRFILAQYGRYQTNKALKAWPTLPCVSLNSWLHTQWEDLCFHDAELSRFLLTETSQELALWLEIITESDEAQNIFNHSAAAAACRRAWYSLVQWHVDLRQEEGVAKNFIDWADAYVEFCNNNDLIDLPSATRLLLDAMQSGKRPVPKKIVLFAFDDIHPQLQRLCEIVKHHGGTIEPFNIIRSANTMQRVALPNVESEIQAAARWACAIVQTTPKAKIGIVIPQLQSLRTQVERIFTETFEPQYVLPDQARHASGFNISAAIPLSATPPIASALLSLKLNFNVLDIEDVSKILHSPFVGDGEEIPAKALFDAYIRGCAVKVRVSQLRQMAGKFTISSSGHDAKAEVDDPSIVNDFYQRLQQFHVSLRGQKNKQAPSAWGALFSHQLSILGWPGSRALDTLEYQQVEVWQQCLAKLSAFDYVFPETTIGQSLAFLERIAFDTPFQAQTYDSSVQVLGVLEAAGMVFDHLWVMNVDNESWPPPINPSSLLPLALQKRESMPMSSVERELMLYKQLTVRFKTSAFHVMFSHSSVDGDKELQVSPLIENIEETQATTLVLADKIDYAKNIYAKGGSEVFLDPCGPQLIHPKTVKGGTQILKDQAACPFRAFARHRLHATAMDEFITGISAAERGILIHDALEIIWKRLHTQSRLLALTDEEIDLVVIEAIEQSFHQLESHTRRIKWFGERLKNLEQERMRNLLRAWLELEKKRAPFKVEFSETKKSLRLAQLPIHIRYDRIDRLDDGSLFVIDYKTGKQEARSWVGERPDEPQVPIYGIANRHHVSGVAFGQIHIDEVAYKGIAEGEPGIPGVFPPEALTRLPLPDSWQEILEHWQRVLESLAKEYIAGVAEVKPKHPVTSCQYCALHNLCRVKELIEVDHEILTHDSRANGGGVNGD